MCRYDLAPERYWPIDAVDHSGDIVEPLLAAAGVGRYRGGVATLLARNDGGTRPESTALGGKIGGRTIAICRSRRPTLSLKLGTRGTRARSARPLARTRAATERSDGHSLTERAGEDEGCDEEGDGDLPAIEHDEHNTEVQGFLVDSHGSKEYSTSMIASD